MNNANRVQQHRERPSPTFWYLSPQLQHPLFVGPALDIAHEICIPVKDLLERIFNANLALILHHGGISQPLLQFLPEGITSLQRLFWLDAVSWKVLHIRYTHSSSFLNKDQWWRTFFAYIKQDFASAKYGKTTHTTSSYIRSNISIPFKLHMIEFLIKNTVF